MFRGKRYVEALKSYDKQKAYVPGEAFDILVNNAKAKFDETVELHVKLGVDSRNADQQVRGVVVLPHGTGKSVRVLVIAKGDKADDATPVYTTLQALPNGQYNMYGIPVAWRAVGYDGLTDYPVTNENGELCYYSYSRVSPWNALEIYARKMAHYERTEDVNLSQQMKPFIGIAPQEKRLELINLLKQVEGGEPAILGDEKMLDLVNNVTVIDTKVPIITEELARSHQNVLNQALLYLGIPHLAFEKGERMIEDEARANTAPTNVMLLDCLQARREFCDKVNRKFGLNVQVYFNDDWESYNYNYLNNAEQLAQDGLIQDDTSPDENAEEV